MRENNEIFKKIEEENTEASAASAGASETVDGTEAVEECGTTTGASITVDLPAETVQTVVNDIHLVMVFTVLMFCKSCLRSWREHTVKTTRG